MDGDFFFFPLFSLIFCGLILFGFFPLWGLGLFINALDLSRRLQIGAEGRGWSAISSV